VGIGDVITHINGDNVLSRNFYEILNLLRNIKQEKRIIGFKNIAIASEMLLTFA
jgi:hypothetical protein